MNENVEVEVFSLLPTPNSQLPTPSRHKLVPSVVDDGNNGSGCGTG